MYMNLWMTMKLRHGSWWPQCHGCRCLVPRFGGICCLTSQERRWHVDVWSETSLWWSIYRYIIIYKVKSYLYIYSVYMYISLDMYVYIYIHVHLTAQNSKPKRRCWTCESTPGIVMLWCVCYLSGQRQACTAAHCNNLRWPNPHQTNIHNKQ